MIEYINQTGRPGKVITIEDPIETVFAVPVRLRPARSRD